MAFSSTTFTVVAAVLAFGWFLARRSVEGLHSLDDLSWMQLSTQSWFTRAWGTSIAILALPAAGGFGVGWSAHRRSGSAAGTAVAAVAVVALAMWQMGEKRDDSLKFKAATAASPRPATDSLTIVSPSGPAEPRPEGTPAKSPIVEEAERMVAKAKAEEDAAKGEPGEAARAAKGMQASEASKSAKANKAAEPADADLGWQHKTGTLSPPAQASTDNGAPLLPNRTRLVVQTETTTSTGTGPGVRPAPPPMQEEKAMAYPSFPGCRWATPTQWVCDGNKP